MIKSAVKIKDFIGYANPAHSYTKFDHITLSSKNCMK